VTIQLERVPEQQALAVLLRSVAGYLAAPRRAGTAGTSQYESVMILATSTPPAAAPAAAAGARGPGIPIARPIPSQVDVLDRPDADDQVRSEGFITVGSAPTPRPTPTAGAAPTGGPVGSPFPQTPGAGARTPNQQPGRLPNGMQRPPNLPPGILLPGGTGIQTDSDEKEP
jgi:hypothetical protein